MTATARFASVLLAGLIAGTAVAGDPPQTASFGGVKANKGSVTVTVDQGKAMLALSADFVVPDTPAPHWQVVDGLGNTFLLQRLVAKDNRFHQTITLPDYIHDVAKVQIWCAFAETLLGEAPLAKVMAISPRPEACPETTHASGMFAGVKANQGTVTHSKQGAMNVLTLSADFVVPDTPAPHWQVVDSNGKVYLLQRLMAKDGRYNQTITVPAYVPDVKKVQIWCAFAETLLGEAAFASPVM